jgi:integration host factor subunit beta
MWCPKKAGGDEMNKSELIEALAQKKDLSFKRSEEIINTIFESIDTQIGRPHV